MTNPLRRRTHGAVLALVLLGVPLLAPAIPAAARPARVAVTPSVDQRDSVLRLYKAYFLREPDRAGWDHWANQYASGAMSLEAISQFFSQSSEFRNRYGTLDDAAFVRLVYQNVLGRAPDSAGVAFWVGNLHTGWTRGRVMLGFSESSEFVRKTGTSTPVVDWVRQFVNLLNGRRATLGRPALAVCSVNMNVAGAHSIDVAKRQVVDLNAADGTTANELMARAGSHMTRGAELVVWVREPYALDGSFVIEEAVKDAKSAFTEGIGDAGLRFVGVGRARGADGRVWWTVILTDLC